MLAAVMFCLRGYVCASSRTSHRSVIREGVRYRKQTTLYAKVGGAARLLSFVPRLESEAPIR